MQLCYHCMCGDRSCAVAHPGYHLGSGTSTVFQHSRDTRNNMRLDCRGGWQDGPQGVQPRMGSAHDLQSLGVACSVEFKPCSNTQVICSLAE